MTTDAFPAGTRIAFLGCGSMNEAILGGLLAAGTPPEFVTATVRRPERAEQLRARHGITVYAEQEDPAANATAAAAADVVLLGVKPVGILALARAIAGSLRTGTLVVSVAAAVTTAMIEAALPAGTPVVRSMPNTPLMVGRGAVGMSAGSQVSDDQLALAQSVFSASGMVRVVPEELQDAVSAVSGSGPAYAFYLAEAMAKAGVALGLDPELALDLARGTVAGAGAMLGEPGADPAGLRRAVTSPNGTTERAIAAFDEQDLPGIIEAGARAAAARAAAITAELGG